jgi:Leucine-rich repeat (LRR) protein
MWYYLKTKPPFFSLCIFYRITNLRTLDLSNNKLSRLPPQLGQTLTNLKSFNCDSNQLCRGSLLPLSKLDKLTTLSLSNNNLGAEYVGERKIVGPPLPSLPQTIKILKLDGNKLPTIPKSIYGSHLVKLEKLDLSNNSVAVVPEELCENLTSLTELNLDHNLIVSLPKKIGNLKKLKSLSLQHNKIRGQSTAYTLQNPQPIPAELFTQTPIVDLNLAGNIMTNGQLNEFDGFDSFLERRQKIKSKNIYGGALTDLNLCGLE